MAEPAGLERAARQAARRVAQLLAAWNAHRLDGDAAEVRRYRVSEKKSEALVVEIGGLGDGRYRARVGDLEPLLDVAAPDLAAVSVLVDAAQFEAVIREVKPGRCDIGVAGHWFRLDTAAADPAGDDSNPSGAQRP